MTNIEIATPNLAELGLEVQDRIVEGYRLDEGYPYQLGYLFIAKMTKAETIADAVKMLEEPNALVSTDLSEPRKPGRPAKAK